LNQRAGIASESLPATLATDIPNSGAGAGFSHSSGSTNERVTLLQPRVTEAEQPLDMAYIHRLTQMRLSVPAIRAGVDLYAQDMLRSQMQFNQNTVLMQLTETFSLVVDEYYQSFASGSIEQINDAGLVVGELVLKECGLVPRIVPFEVVQIYWRYDHSGGGMQFRAERLIKNGGTAGMGVNANAMNVGQAINAYTAVDSNTSQYAQDRISGGMYNGDTIRPDFGRYLPRSTGPDPLIFVIPIPGLAPRMGGIIQSPMATLYPRYLRQQREERLYILQEIRTHQEVPLVETETNSEEQRNQLLEDAYRSTIMSAVANGTERYTRMEVDREMSSSLNRLSRYEALQQRLGLNMTETSSRVDSTLHPATMQRILESDGALGALEDTFSAGSGRTHKLDPGDRVSSFHSHYTGAPHLQNSREDFLHTVATALRLPMIMIDAKHGASRDMSAAQRRMYLETLRFWAQRIGRVMTTVYDMINGPGESSERAKRFYNEILRKDVLDSIARNYRVYYEALEHADPRTYKLLSEKTNSIIDAVTARMHSRGRGGTKGDSRTPTASTLKSKSASPTKQKATTETASNGKQNLGDRLLGPNNGSNAEDGEYAGPGMEQYENEYHEPLVAEGMETARIPYKPRGPRSRSKERVADKVFNAFATYVKAALKNPPSPALDLATLRSMFSAIDSVADAERMEHAYDAIVLEEEVRALLFLEQLRAHETKSIVELFENGGPATNAVMLDRMFINFIETDANYRMKVSFPTPTDDTVPLEELLKAELLGIVSPQEVFGAVRGRLSMPVATDGWKPSPAYKTLLKVVEKQMHETLSAEMGLQTPSETRKAKEAAQSVGTKRKTPSSSSGSDKNAADEPPAKRSKAASELGEDVKSSSENVKSK